MIKPKIYKNRRSILGFYVGLLPPDVFAVGAIEKWRKVLHETQQEDYFDEIECLRCSERSYVIDLTYANFIEQRLKHDLVEASDDDILILPEISEDLMEW